METVGGGRAWWHHYEPRRVTFLHLWRDAGWTVKAYVITAGVQTHDPAVVGAA